MDAEGDKWVTLPKYSDKYRKGVKRFITNAFAEYALGKELKCPCKNCSSRYWNGEDVIHEHLICNGLSPQSIEWIYEVSNLSNNDVQDRMDTDHIGMGLGEEFERMIHNINPVNESEPERKGMNDEARRIYRLVEKGGEPLYPECTKFTRLSFIVRLYQLKCMHGFSESAFSDLLKLIKEVFPNVNIPSSFNASKRMIKDLGLDYQKIHACPNDCMIFWAEDEKMDFCKICGASRWKEQKKKDNNDTLKEHKIPLKVLRYFPLKKRLQRMYLTTDLSKLMTWHALARKKDGLLRHPADGKGWKEMDAKYPDFAEEIRNVRLGLASDGFNPYRTMSISHSTWPIVLVNYNLPPWLIMKPENLILSTIIPGPVQPGNEIDVFMQPLIAELKDLWEVGIQTYDRRSDSTFKLQASLLWTINDFPGYGVLSGWSTKGHLACPSCHYETSSTYLKHSKKVIYMNHRKFLPPNHKWRTDKRRFNGEVEMKEGPNMLTGKEVETLLSDYVNDFGKQLPKQRGCSHNSPWKKKSIFFELPYWSSHMVRHNLDVMHIEKNICDKILGTLLNIGGKTKDHVNGRLDLKEMGIRKVLHPYKSADGEHLEIRAACFDMTKQEKEIFCSVLYNAKLPHGSVSNISRCVQIKERKVSGYKSHDAHYILQYLLQFAVVKTLKPEVAIPLMRLGAFFRRICGKVIELDDVQKLQDEITEILCQLEMIFPPSFFDIMVHLPIHLCKEIEYGGPVHLRWMYGIERYLCKLKAYVRNRSKPEGSIAEGYLAEECLTFCSRILGNQDRSKTDTNVEKDAGYAIGSRKNKDGKSIHLEDKTWTNAHTYILFNCENVEIESLIQEHRSLVEKEKRKRYKRERTHTTEFHKWLKEAIKKKDNVSVELSSLAKGPQRAAKRYTGYVVNGFRFHTKHRDGRCTTQNSGVFLTALTTSFASVRDKNPVVGDVGYYGAVEDIIEVDYWGVLTVVLFKCSWYQKERDYFGLTRVNFNRLYQKDDPFVLATQVQQVYYIEDPTETGIHFVIKKLPINQYSEVEERMTTLEDVPIGQMPVTNVSWDRDDVPEKQIPLIVNDEDEMED